jgi:radical SAM protein with 4Fe4S-binding SPASM domain
MRRILDAQAQPSECGAGRGYLTVGPDGRLYACHREACTQIGWLRDGKPEFSLERLRWIENRVSANADCMRCWARYLCGGGCRQAKAELAGSLHKNLESLCDLKRTLLRETFWILAQLGPDVDRLFPRRLLVRERRHAASRV